MNAASGRSMQVLDHGFVTLVESWGSDERIVEAARMSTDKGFLGWGEGWKCSRALCDWTTTSADHHRNGPCPTCGCTELIRNVGDEKLLGYLWKNNHATPFEMAGCIIEVQAPIFVFREWHRHRTQCAHPDTLVHFDAPRSRENRRFVYKMRIEDIWKKWQPTTRSARPERQTNALFPRTRIQAMQLRNLDEEACEFGHTTIVDVIRGEPKEMVRVTAASGRSVALTRDHRVLTSEGWMRLGEALKKGALLTLEGTTRARAMRWEPPTLDEGVEEWRTVVGWEGLYQVSSEGRVRRVGSAPKKTTVGVNGYNVASLSRDGRTVTHLVHSLVLAAFSGPRLEGMEARHLNSNRADARAKNLVWGTAAENARDRVDADRQQRLVPVFEEIAEVQKLGMVPTFDLAVEGPWHNFIADGFVVHNSYNELSARYTPMPDINYVPSIERIMINAGTTNKQAGTIAGAETLTRGFAEGFQIKLRVTYEMAEAEYQAALTYGVPKELARLVIPVGRYSRMRASSNLRNWLSFLTLRMDKAAQWEIRQYANAVHELLTPLFPRTLALFDESSVKSI